MSQDSKRFRSQTRTPEAQTSKQRTNGSHQLIQDSPDTPGTIAPFDWDEFEQRYKDAIREASQDESRLIEEFERLVAYFNIWAASARDHDAERAIKRLQTREMHVRNSEMTLAQKKQHYTEVVKAFKSALALLSDNNR